MHRHTPADTLTYGVRDKGEQGAVIMSRVKMTLSSIKVALYLYVNGGRERPSFCLVYQAIKSRPA